MKISVDVEDVSRSLFLSVALADGEMPDGEDVSIGASGDALLFRLGSEQFKVSLTQMINEIYEKVKEPL